MSKKKFKHGLESLFDHPGDVKIEVQNTATGDDFATHEVSASKRHSKNFTSDLDSLFEDALKESMEEQFEKLKKNAGIEEDTHASQTRYSGIDALIRQTLDSGSYEVDYLPTKRVTFVFDHKKLDKLKSIAKMEKAYIKDIINSVISGYIEEYEKKKGKLN